MKFRPSHLGRRAAALLCAAILFAGILSRGAGNEIVIDEPPTPLSATTISRTMVYAPKSTGEVSYSKNNATIDASNAAEGYVTAKYNGGSKKVKVLITKSGGTKYTYDLRTDGQYEVFPLTSGNGRYTIGIYTNVEDTRYAEAVVQTISVELRNSFLPFLYPSQYVDFNSKSKTVAKAQELATGAKDTITIVQNVYNYCVQNISYDTAKAKQVTSGSLTGYLPAVDSVLTSGKGICFDYAAVMTAMLRSQQIPTRLEIGYVSNGAYHAWISTYIQDVGWVNGIIQFDGKSWKMMDPTFAASLGDSGVTQYIGNGTNYKRQYLY